MSAIDVRRAGSRAHTELGWLDSWHSFSFGPHHDPANTHHGLLRVSNDDRIRAGTGFGTHHHEDMEIVTWVLSGQLEHHDSEGNHGVLYPGLAQRMSAGVGIDHSETNPSSHEDVHLVQMWVFPDTRGIAPGYEQRDVNPELALGGLRPIVSGAGHDGAIVIHQRDAVLWAGRLRPGETVMVPEGPRVHVFVAAGDVTLAGAGGREPDRWETGDAARLSAAGSPVLDAGATGAELLVWVTA